MQHKITSLSPYTTQIGLIVSEINIIRNETLELTKNLSISELDFNFDSQSNSIGTLLLHIATVELKFQLDHFLMRSITMSEFRKFGNAAPQNMHKRLVFGNDYEFYTKNLHEVRQQTLEQLKNVTDDWLYKEVTTSNGTLLGNHYYLLKHIIHDELCHQGQIKIILKRLKASKSRSA